MRDKKPATWRVAAIFWRLKRFLWDLKWGAFDTDKNEMEAIDMKQSDSNATAKLLEALQFRMDLLQLDLSLNKKAEREKAHVREHVLADEAALQEMRRMYYQ
jgi:hypothetical protein